MKDYLEMTEKEQILEDMKPLFAQANKEKKWFFCNYQSLWFSPKNLRNLQSKNQFIWGACNWHLKEPAERLNRMDKKIQELKLARTNFVEDIETGWENES